MIPSTTNQLLVAEDWTKIYQSFKNAEFKSYDFETLRRTMITYLRENYPEDFNDYIDSSEYIALIDLIAYLGQNLSFRIDLNARENFLETAERRDSVLRLARLINYNAKRNSPARGFLKITSISTTENVADSNGINLANSIVGWNDPSNSNWYQQFISIMNAAMASPTVFGKPYAAGTIDGIATEQYKINTSTPEVPIYSFNKSIAGTQMGFELVPSTFSGQDYVYEDTPLPGNQFGFIFKNDNKGSGSANTGFFVQFRQGNLTAQNFSVDNPVPNELVGVNVSNINDTDVWLWKMSEDNTKHQSLWTKVSATTGNNVIYNSLNLNDRDIYSVLTRDNDQIDLSFADGSFGNLPNGPFRLYYRQSNGLSYIIKPEQLNNISVQIPYYSQNGQSNALTLVLSLQYTVTNSVGSESNADVKLKAPQAYYTQNRMITAEDYNIAPLTVDADILKVKSVNRTASGISKYYELSDVSGKYSSTDIFADDGALYQEDKEYNFEFTFNSRNEVVSVVKSQLAPIVDAPNFYAFYLSQYPKVSVNSLLAWNQSNKTTNQTRGYFNNNGIPATLGIYASEELQFFVPGALVKMEPPTGHYFLPNGKLTTTQDTTTSLYKWTQIVNVVGDGTNNGTGNLPDGTGPVTLTGTLPGNGTIGSSAQPTQVIPRFQTALTYALETEIVNLCLSKRNFGLSFDSTTRTWYVITDANIDLKNTFSLLFQKDISNTNKDTSWMVAFEWTGKKYIVRYRVTDYVFESDKKTAFFIDQTKKNYDFVTDTVIKDRIEVLSVNESPLQPISTLTTTALAISTSAGIVGENTTSTFTLTSISTSSIVAAETSLGEVTAIAIVTATTLLVANVITTSTTLVTDSFIVRTTTTSSSISTSTLYLDSTGITTSSHVAIHPSIPGGYSTVTNLTTTTVTLASTITTAIVTGTDIVFVPTNITTTVTSVISCTTDNSFKFTTITERGLYLENSYNWQIDSAVIQSDGYVEPKKVLISFYDNNDDGQIDDPDAFENIVNPTGITPQTGYLNNYVYFQLSADRMRSSIYAGDILAYPTENNVQDPIDGQLYYFYDPLVNVVKSWDNNSSSFVLQPLYYARPGRKNIKFHYVHNSGDERRLDPSKSNIIDVYLLTKSYDLEYRNWLASAAGAEPLPPTTQSLESNYSAVLEPIKAISDEIIYHPVNYKVLFGGQALAPLQATFKAVSNPTRTISTTDLQTRILSAIEDFFAIENWDFGQSFNFSELSTYVMNRMTPDIINFVIVPKMDTGFGSLYQITCGSNEIFINGATVNDIQIIDNITASELKASSTIVTSS